MLAASLISFSDGAIFGKDNKMGFTGLTYDGDNRLIKLNPGEPWWVPPGQVKDYPNGIPMRDINGDKLINNITLTATKT